MEFSQEVERFRFLVLAMQRQGNRIYKDLLSDIGITPSQAEVIQILKKWEQLSLKELGALLICETGSPSRLIDRMVKDGYIERMRSTDDSRFVKLRLTELGIEKSGDIKKAENEMYQMIEKIYKIDELKSLNHYLSNFLSNSSMSETLTKRGFLEEEEH
ncbi:MarR family winged helix-turn-helix transcriptional regulator [Falsibacillus albus]|uniref:MarR family transcriptional regulator n=1 Tax=Falsibacillus albus TaxID=2478915 RepID=A0A3L7JWH3_9BACI|nr:MarR family transcriptional regulator [Falsibacillus albus]RLQ94604.1 MarR family transcriptional regulator [Falsibacillus albus]